MDISILHEHLHSLFAANAVGWLCLALVLVATVCALYSNSNRKFSSATPRTSSLGTGEHLDSEGKVYEDEDGSATASSQAAFEDRAMRIIVVFAALGTFAAALLDIILTLLEAGATPKISDYVFGMAWFLVLFQAVLLSLDASSVSRFAIGIYISSSSLILLLGSGLERYILISEHESGNSTFSISKISGVVNIIAGIGTMLAASSLPRRPDVYKYGKIVDAQYTVSTIFRCTFSWLWPLLRRARVEGKLELKDLPHLDHNTSASVLESRFNLISASRQSQPLWYRLLLDHKSTFCYQWILVSIESFILVAPQICLFNILSLLEIRHKQTYDTLDMELWFWIAAMAVSKLTLVYLETWRLWVSFGPLAVQVRSQLFALIFLKSMNSKEVKVPKKSTDLGDTSKLKDTVVDPELQALLPKEDEISPEEQGYQSDTSVPDDNDDVESPVIAQTALNLLGLDVDRVVTFCGWSPDLLGSVLKLIVATWFLVLLIGWPSTLAGMALPIAMQPLTRLVSGHYYAAQEAVMMARDEKTHIITEALHGIRQIKFSALEQKWQNIIMASRDRELARQRWLYVLATVLTFLWMFLPILLGTVALGTYAYTSGTMTASVAFTALSVFQSLEWTLGVIPNTITEFFNARVSIKRIQAYLDVPDKKRSTVPGKFIKFEEATVTWPSDTDEADDEVFALTHLNLEFPDQELSVIHGKTGSGKSLMLAAIIGEADVIAGRVYAPLGPSTQERCDALASNENWIIPSATAFVAQISWVEHATVKENILFGLPYEPNRYKKVMHACALEEDLRILHDGDETEIGPSGINLSGGQKWRITFARALYSRAGILVMDDIFSAVDTHIGHHLLEYGLAGELGIGRTRILVTHHIDLVKDYAGYIVELGDNRRVKDIISKDSLSLQPNFMLHSPQGLGKDPTEASTITTKDTGSTRAIPKKFIEEEKRGTGRVKWSVYKTYIKASGSPIYFVSALLLFVLSAVTALGRSYWVRLWSKAYEDASNTHASTSPVLQENLHDDSSEDHLKFYLSIYLLLSVLSAILLCAKIASVFIAAMRASRQLFSDMTYTVLRAPLRWLDTVPTGRILNRFVSDFALIDIRLGGDFQWFLTFLFTTVLSCTAALFVSFYSIAPVFALAIVSLFIIQAYLSGARDVKRLDSISRSPVFELVGSSLAGLSTIRTFDKTETYIQRMHDRIDDYGRTSWHLQLMAQWMSFNQGVLGTAFSIIIACLVVVLRDVDASLAGFALGFAMEYTTAAEEVVRRYTSFELEMNSTERVVEYSDMPAEEQAGDDVPSEWPSQGAVTVEHLEISYAPDSPSVLTDLNFTIEPRQRIGVVGRTGSGKSSLTLALFRLLNVQNGRILIDGLDISTIKLHDLRSRVVIIPQDPVLFSGTLRSNLDPFDEHSDESIHDALTRVHLSDLPIDTNTSTLNAKSNSSNGASTSTNSVLPPSSTFQNLSMPISRGGLNLSQGQRQLVCLARCLISRPRVLVLDEATSAVDMKTDQLIQKSIRELFKDSTLIVVAHRLSTIADFDKAMVLKEGRIIEFGKPADLWNDGGQFRDMVDKSGERAALEDILSSKVSQ